MKKYIYIPSIYPKIRRLFYLTSLLLGTILCAKAQVTISLDYKEKNNLTTVQSGDKYTLQLDYSVSSTTGNASNVKAVINLPDNIYTVGEFVGTTHAPVANFVFTNTVGAKKLTINFINPVPSGSTGVLEFIVRTNNLTTPNNTQLCTTAEITDGSGATSGVKNHCMTVTAIPRICALKTVFNGGAIDNITTYRVRVSANGGSNPLFTPFGTLQATNITVTDNLPANVEFISAKVYNVINGAEVGTGTYSAGVVTASIPNLTLRQYGNSTWESFYYNLDIQVKFNSPTFSASDVVTNTATVAYTPFTGTASVLNDGDNVGGCVSDLTETTTLATPVTSAVLTKSAGSNVNAYPGQRFSYTWSFTNTGNTPLENVEIIETIPANVVIDQDAEYNGVRVLDWVNVNHIEYQTNVSGSTWVVLAAGAGVPDLPSGTLFTKLKFVLRTPLPPGAALLANNHILHFKSLTEVTTTETVTNCMEWTSTTAGIPNQAGRTACNSSVKLLPRPTTAKAIYNAGHLSSCSQVIGGTVTFTGMVIADVGYADGTNPVCALLIPAGFTYVPGSETFTANNSGITTPPTLEIIPNYITTGGKLRDLYRWTFPSGTVLPHGERFSVNVSVKISPALAAGSYNADFIATFSNASVNEPDYNFGNFVDTKDWDLDGNTTESIGRANSGYGQCDISIAASASMESIKWVKGLCDVAYSRYPAFGQTVPGGDADYRLIIKNTGNVVMKDIKIIDILPFIGDRGVIDPQARQTQWRPNLANPISAPAGVTVYYTTVSNPCRDEVKQPADPSPFPTGCTPPNWSVTPPLDITQVQAVKIDFGTKTLAGGDSLVFSWPMRAPVDAPTNDEIAWNSFGFVATRSDNNQPLLAAEPIKVGIKLKPIQPAVYGDYVWIDTNKNGIQDDGATGVSGVRVELYKDNGDGISDPATDLFVGFTVTDGTGKYLFSTLQPGDYFAKFYPPAGYVTTTSNQGGNDALDSDGIITIVTTLDAGEDDRTWDLGIYQDTNCDVKITNYTLSPCVWTGTASEVTVNVFVAWANAPSGQNINVVLNGVTQTIDLTTATSPALVSFTLPANNTDYVLNAVFSGTSTCKDSKTIRTPLPCEPAVCVLNIDAVNVGACKDGKAPLDIVVSWSNNPAGENIVVTAGDSTRIINVSGGVLSPVTVNFNMPSSGQVDVPISVGFQTTTACKDTDKFTLPNCICIKPNAGNDVSVCAPATTAKLTATTAGGTWAPIGSPANPAAATIDANGNVIGMTVAGTYRFVYSVSGLNCTDTAAVHVHKLTVPAVTALCHANGTPEDGTDDYMTFSIHVSTTPMSANKFTVTATQGGNPLAITLSNGSAATAINCGLNTPLRTPAGSAGKGNVTLTITDNVTGCTTTVVVTDPGTCAVVCVQGTPSTVTYEYATQVDVTELNALPIVIPKFDEQGGTRVLKSVKLEYLVGGKTAFVFENRAAQSQSFNAQASSEATINLNGADIATNTLEMLIPQTTLPGGILVPATGAWAGDSIPSPTPTPTTLGRMESWVSDYLTVFKDPRTDARWVTNATGDATDDDDMYINPVISDSVSGTFTYNTALTLAPFIGTGNVPLNVSTLSGLSLTGGGGNLRYLQRTRAYASAKVTYTFECILCTKPVALATPKAQTICAGGTVSAYTATPSTGVEYKWYGPLADTTSSLGTAVSGAISATFTPSGAALTTVGTKYYAVVVNTTGDETCADTAYVRLVVNAKPNIADGSATICAGESVNLTSRITNYATYLSPVWTVGTASGTAVATPTSVTPTGTTTYVLVAQNALGCKDTANVVVTVNPKPNAGKDTTLVCVNAATNTLATSYTLVPSPAGGTWAQLGTTPATATITGNNVTNMTVVGTYQFIYTTVAGCKDTVAVTVAPCAGCVKPNAGSDAATVCQPTSTAKLTAVTTGGTWAPIGSPANPSAASTDANGNITGLNAAGTYRFVYSITSGGQTCTDTAQVVVNAKPNIADGSATICAGESVNLTSRITNYATYLSPVWTVGTASGTAVATPTSVKPTGTTTYVLVAQNAAGCKDTANVVVTVNAKPSAGKDTTLACVNAATNTLATSYTLVPSPAGGTWAQLGTTPATATITGNNVTNMSVVGTYQFIYTTTAGCKDTIAVTVAPCAGCVKPNAGPDAAAVCQPTSTAKLTALTTGGTWAPIGSPANPSAASIDANGNITGLNAAGTYRFVYSITSGGQTCTDTAQVVVNAKPNIADGSATICAGESVNLTSRITNYATYLSPVWTVGTASGTTVATPTSVKPTGTTTYVLVAQNAAGCKDTANVVVTMNPKPNAGKDTTLVCVNAATNTLATSYTLVPSPAGGTWAQLGTTPATATITGNNVTNMTVAGKYQFIYTTVAGCKDTVAVTVAPCAGCVKPNAGSDAAAVCQPTSTAKLTAVTTGGTWAPIGSPANPSAASIDANGNITGLNAAGTYRFVYSITSGGQTCTDTAQVVVNAKPNIADGSATICEGESVNLTSRITNYATYLSPVWIVGTASGTAVGTPTSVKPTGTTTYVLVAQNALGCKDTANVVVTVNPKPSAGKDTTLVCSNGNVPASVQLSATPTGGTWSALAGNPTGATVNSSGLVSITNATAQGKSFDFIYLVNGCQDTVKVIVPTCPAPCVASSVTLSNAPVCSADAQTYSFSFTVNNKLGIVKVNKGTLSGNNPYTITGIPSGASVTIIDSLSAVCKSDTIIVGPNCNCNPAMPQLLTPSLTACIGDTFPTLKATVVGLATVEWFSQQTGGTVLATGLSFKPSGTVSANAVFYAQARSTDPTCPTAVSTSRVPATINAQTCIDTIDLALKKSINTKIARVGDVLTYTIKVWNEWTKNATGVEVVDSIATTVQFVSGSFLPSRGSATISGNVIKWNIGNIAANGDTVTLRYQVRATTPGVHLNTAEISKANEKDRDSTPGNGKGGEDDIDQQCFTVPFELCAGQKLEVGVPANLTNVQWFKNGGTTVVATGNVVLFSEDGVYTFTATNQTCPSNGCCPVIIEPGTNCCPVDLCIPYTVKKVRK